MRVRAKQKAECNGITLSFNLADESASGMVDIQMASFKGSGKFSLIGGSADGMPAGKFGTYDVGKWHNVDITGKNGVLTTYIDGVLCDRRVATDVKADAAGGLRRVVFDMGRTQTGAFDFDDMEVWGAYDVSSVTASSIQNGDVGVGVDSAITVTFNNQIDPEKLDGITLSSDSGNAQITAALSADMKTVTITPESSLYTLTEYTLSLNGIKDIMGYDVYTEDISFTTAARSYDPSAGEKLLVNDSFENYTDVTGTIIPAGWTLHTNSVALDNGNFAVKSGNDDENRYLSMSAQDQSEGFVRLYQTIADNPKDYLLHYRVKANQTLEDACVTLRIFDDDGIEFSPIQLKSSGKFSPIGGKSDRVATGVIPEYTADRWYTIDVVSRSVGADAKITTYVDGKLVDSAMLSEVYPQSKLVGVKRLSVQLTKGNYENSELGLDDIKLYTAFDEMKLVSGSVLNGKQDVSVSDSQLYTFSNMVDSGTIGGITIKDENGEPANITARLDDDLKTVIITLNEALYSTSSYTVDFGGIKDVLGGGLTSFDGITFTTEFGVSVKADVENCAVKDGSFTADVTFKNMTASEQNFKGIAAIYDVDKQTKSAVLDGVAAYDVKLGARESKIQKVEIGDGMLNGNNYTVKVFMWDSLSRLAPVGDAIAENYIGAEIVPPTDFGELPFQVYRMGTRKYAHTATPESVMDLSDAVEVFISSKGGTNGSDGNIKLGLEKSKPITPGTFGQTVDAGRYETESGTYILTCVDEVHDNLSINLENHNAIKNLYIRSGSEKGISWVGNIAEPVWTQYEDTGVYTADLSGNAAGTVMYPVNLTDVDEYGMPSVYCLAGDLDTCLASPGTYVRVENTLYVHPFSGEAMANLKYLWKNGRATYVNYGNVNVIFENMGFFGGCYSFKPNSTDSEFYVFNSKFFRGTTDAFAISGAYSAYVIDSVAAYATADGFNYHATDNNSRAVEINCVSYCNGTKYRVDSDTDKGTNSNNGSTAHNSIKMLRIGGEYQWCEGPIVADTNNCYSISIGCTAENIYDTTTGIRAAYMLSDASEPSTDKPYAQKKYLIDCYAGGVNLVNGCSINVSGDAVGEVFVLDLDGDTRSTTAYGEIRWDDIMSGAWK